MTPLLLDASVTTALYAIGGLVALIFLIIIFKYLGLYVQAVLAHADVGLFDMLAMSLRKVSPALIVRANREQSDNAVATRETLDELRRLNARAVEAVQGMGVAPLLAGRARPAGPPDAGPAARR